MASTWGTNTWGSNEWADDTVTVTLSGQSATSNVGTTLEAFNTKGWGRDDFGNGAWGVEYSVELSGQSATSSVGSITTEVAYTVSIGSGPNDQMRSNYGDVTVDTIEVAELTGVQSEFATPTLSYVGTLVGWGRDAWSARAWGAPNQIVNPTGIAITATLGDETVVNEINVGWGRLTWGENAWGERGDVILSGIAMSASLGNESISIDVSPTVTGIPMTASQGDESIEISFEIEPIGIAATANLGIADAGPDAMATGIGFSANVGTLEAYNLEGWGRYFWGQFEWGATGEWESVTPTGISMSVNVGTVVATPNTIATPSGIAITATLSEESVVGDATAQVTGIGLTMSINSANALIWNEVNTGSAPIDPPGWVEVPTRAA